MEEKESLLPIKPAVVYRQESMKWDEKKIEAWKKSCGVLNFGGLIDDLELCKRVRYGE
ncbi:MAG: hypothetical protein ACXVC1_07795 [Tumebacillaceae bacterium]